MKKGKRLYAGVLAVILSISAICNMPYQDHGVVSAADNNAQSKGLLFGSSDAKKTYLQLSKPLESVPKTIEASVKMAAKSNTWDLSSKLEDYTATNTDTANAGIAEGVQYIHALAYDSENQKNVLSKLNTNLNIDLEDYNPENLALTFRCYSTKSGALGRTGGGLRLGNNSMNCSDQFLMHGLDSINVTANVWNEITIPLSKWTNSGTIQGYTAFDFANGIHSFVIDGGTFDGEVYIKDMTLRVLSEEKTNVDAASLVSNNMIFSNTNIVEETAPLALFLTSKGYPSFLVGTQQFVLHEDVRTGEWIDLKVALDTDNNVMFYVNGDMRAKSATAVNADNLKKPMTCHSIGADGLGNQIINGYLANVKVGNGTKGIHHWPLNGDILITSEPMEDITGNNPAKFCGCDDYAQNIPFTMEKTIVGKGLSTVGATVEKVFSPIDMSACAEEQLKLVMDIEITSKSGKLSKGLFYDGQIELTSSGTCDKEELGKAISEINWKYGKHEYAFSLSAFSVTNGPVDYAGFDYMRIYLNQFGSDFEDTITFKVDNVRLVEKARERWSLTTLFSDGMMFQQNKEMNVWGYGAPGETVTATLYKQDTSASEYQIDGNSVQTVVADSGKWELKFPAHKGSYATYRIEIQSGVYKDVIDDIVIGELWIACGQSNMELPVKKDLKGEEVINNANYPYVRFYAEPTFPVSQFEPQPVESNQDVVDAYWGAGNEPVNVANTSSLAYNFAVKLQTKLDIPVGYINCSVGDTRIETWLSRTAIESDAQVKDAIISKGLYQETATNFAKDMSNLYNAKIGPLEGMNIAGVIWYQGCTNSQYSDIYGMELDLLKRSWGKVFGYENGDMPLIFTQVAPYAYSDNNSTGYLAENMKKAWELSRDKKTAMLALYDLPLDHMKMVQTYKGALECTYDSIHPRSKTMVAERFYQSAVNMLYGGTEAYTAPVYKSMTVRDGAIYLTFDCIGNHLTSTDGSTEIHGFSIAGEDGVYVNASAKIVDKDMVMVWNDRIKDPQNVIYAFANYNQGANLCNSAKIPASPFRTVQVEDTVKNQDSSIQYFLPQDWMHADKDVWVKDSTDTQLTEGVASVAYVGLKPSFQVNGGAKRYQYTSEVKSEGTASVKVTYDGDFTLSPILTYDSIVQSWKNYKYITVSVKNDSAVELGMKIGNVPLQIAGTDRTTVAVGGVDTEFTTVTFDLSTANSLLDQVSTQGVVFEVTTNGNGDMYFDSFQFGMTEKVEHYQVQKFTVAQVKEYRTDANKETVTLTIDKNTKIEKTYYSGENITCPDGYVFAGWFIDKECQNALTDTLLKVMESDKNIYAKFVKKEVFQVKAQVSANVLDDDKTNDSEASMRFVSTVDSLLYQRVGFKLERNQNDEWKPVWVGNNIVYGNIFAMDGMTIITYAPEVFMPSSEYFKAYKVTGITNYNEIFKATTYVVTLDGTIVYGDMVQKSISMGIQN